VLQFCPDHSVRKTRRGSLPAAELADASRVRKFSFQRRPVKMLNALGLMFARHRQTPPSISAIRLPCDQRRSTRRELDSVTVRKLGPIGTYGWLARLRYQHSGEVDEWVQVYGVTGNSRWCCETQKGYSRK
jgi:hypothetical protein